MNGKDDRFLVRCLNRITRDELLEKKFDDADP